MLRVMRFIRLLLACVVFVLLPYACADSGGDGDTTGPGPSSSGSNTGGGGTSTGPSSGGGGSGNTGGNNAGGAGGNSTGGGGGMPMCNMGGGGPGGAGSCVASGHCEICAEAQCTSEWNTCCSTTGCIALARCVFDNCNADPLAITCIQAMCTAELAAAGGIGGPGATPGIALASCLQNQFGTPPSNDCACCDIQVNP
jgi:hypothetical protein